MPGRSGGGLLAATCLLVAAGFSGVVLWLALTAEATMLDLREQADRLALVAERELSRSEPTAVASTGPGDAVEAGHDGDNPDGVATDRPDGGDAVDLNAEPAVAEDAAEAVPLDAPPASDPLETASADPAPDPADASGGVDRPVDEPPAEAVAEALPTLTTAGHQEDAPAEPADSAGTPTADASAVVDHEHAGSDVTEPDPADIPPGEVSTASDGAAVEADSDAPPVNPLAAVLPASLPVTVAGPDPALMDLTDAGPLPRIGDDGVRPREAYARPFDTMVRRPRVAIAVTSLGLMDSETNAAIEMLPGPVTLAFSPYADGLDDWFAAARAEGHEALLMLPMEPADFPLNDPGPNTLLGHLPEEENRIRLDWALSRAAGYPGVTNLMGSELAERPDVVRMLLQRLNERGLYYLDSQAVPRPAIADVALEVGIPYVANDRTLDIVADPVAIDRALESLEALALERGYAVGVARGFPVTVRRIERWARGLEDRGLVLAPVSAIANPSVDG